MIFQHSSTESYGVSFRIQSECGKMGTRITPNPDTFRAVYKKVYFMTLGEIGSKWTKIHMTVFYQSFTKFNNLKAFPS